LEEEFPMKNGVLFVGLGVGVALFLGWAVFAVFNSAGGWRGLAAVWPFVVGGLFGVGALTGVLMWLAFYSANHGYDDPPEPTDPPHDPGQ
jgi:hypothetical protein